MPTRGYRKGTSDAKEPLPHHIYTRLSAAGYQALNAEAASRAITVSELVRRVVTAHLAGQRAELPQPRGLTNQAIAELCRIGNNINQLAKQANVGLVAVSEATLLAVLDQVNAAARRLG